MTNLEHTIKHIKTRADAWAVKEVTEALQSISERLDKALSQEPCDDAVSRKSILKYIDDWWSDSRDDIEDLIIYITYLPSVTQKPKYWIDKDNKIYKMPDDIPIMTIQYPTIQHGDTISRTEVMKVISDFVTFEKYIDKHNHITFEPLEKMINALPSVTQKTGKWIKGKDEYGTNHFTCPFCGHDIATKAENWDDNYCANCGAKMESEDNE